MLRSFGGRDRVRAKTKFSVSYSRYLTAEFNPVAVELAATPRFLRAQSNLRCRVLLKITS